MCCRPWRPEPSASSPRTSALTTPYAGLGVGFSFLYLGEKTELFSVVFVFKLRVECDISPRG